jgi:predicted amidohydrolase YtcJ
LGSGGSDDLWKQIDGKKLDELTPDNPVFLYNADAGSALANSFAIKAARVRETKPGIVTGPQFERIRHVVPADHGKRWGEIAETASNYAASFGITSVQDTDSDDHAAVYRELARQGKLKVRIYDCHGLPNWKKYAESGLKAATGDAMVRTGCLKGTADVGVVGKIKLQRDVTAADKAGMQVLLHAIGSAMNKAALDVFENAVKENGKRDRRFRIEHAERAAPEDIPRFARLGVIASMQPHLFSWEGSDAGYYRLLQPTGATVAFGSDAPMADIDPMLGILAAWKGIKFAETIDAYTKGSAYAEFQEDLKGTIEVGKLADLVILTENSLSHREKTNGSRILFTIVDGKVVFQAD